MQTLAGGNWDAEAFATLESDSDSEESFASPYKSSHDTPNDPEDDESDDASTPEPTEEVTLGSKDRQSPNKTERTPTPTVREAEDRIPTPPTEEAKDRIPTPPAEEAKDRTPTTPAEEVKDRTSSPPKERKEEYTQPEQPYEDDTMSYPYPKYRDDPDAKAHVYAFLQTWEANHVSQRLTEPEAERSKVAEFGMTLEGPAAQWHTKHLPGSFATFEALKTKFLRLFHWQVEQWELVGQFYTTRQEE